MKFAFIDEAKATWPAAVVCRNLGVTPAGYYAWKGRPASPRATATATLAEGVKAAFAEGRGTFGSPRVYQALLARGVACCVNTVAKLLKSLGLAARPRRRKPRPAGPGDGGNAATPNLLDRQFAATARDQKWGQRHHVHPDVRGLALPRGGSGFVIAADRRLGVG